MGEPMKVRKLIIEDVRCFSGRQELNIRPLTFLVGENSTGKTTALGSLQTLQDFIRSSRPEELDFNVDPFHMGAFTNIVRRSNPRINQFKIGIEACFTARNNTIEYTLSFSERERGSEPRIAKQQVISPIGEIEFTGVCNNDGHARPAQPVWPSMLTSRKQIMEGNSGFGKIDRFYLNVPDQWLQSPLLPVLSRFDTGVLNRIGTDVDVNKKVSESKPDEVAQLQDEMALKRFIKMFTDMAGFGTYESTERILIKPPSMCSFAPIRSKPQRTYNPLREDLNPDGSDVPMMMMNMARGKGDSWESLRSRLKEFGASSGLFTDVSIRKLGGSSGDPFQLQIKVRGPKVNVIDVGYGVNQIIPILVRILTDQDRTVFLMQQPEVHLHPKAHAALSSLIVDLIRNNGNEFILETHSDHMINRARIEIMNRRIAAEDVALIYLEPDGNAVNVHNIEFDDQANLLNVPKGYRDFFIDESNKLLGFSK